jgi:ribose 5-phosphate isomerase B
MPRRRVITERDVRKAVRDGSRYLDPADAVVTPSARDAAKRAGLEIGKRDAAVGAAPPPSKASVQPLTIAVGADHGGVSLKDTIAVRLRELGHTVTDFGTAGTTAVDYPDFAIAVARAVATGQARLGIMVDGAGIGSCMAANKIRGVRAAMCYDVTTAANAREHNNANVLTLGGGLLGPRLAIAVVETFLATEFGGGRHAGRVAKIDALDAT